MKANIPSDYYPPKREVFGICISNDMMDVGKDESVLEDGCTEIEELADGAIINRYKWVFVSVETECYNSYFEMTWPRNILIIGAKVSSSYAAIILQKFLKRLKHNHLQMLQVRLE